MEEEIEKRFERLEQDMWFGNGKPGITTRMAVVEDCVDRISKNLSRITWLLVAAVLTAVADIIVRNK